MPDCKPLSTWHSSTNVLKRPRMRLYQSWQLAQMTCKNPKVRLERGRLHAPNPGRSGFHMAEDISYIYNPVRTETSLKKRLLCSSRSWLYPMSSPNGLVCFTNCLLPQEDGSLIKKDLWVDQTCGLILDAQASRRKMIQDRFIYQLQSPSENIL